MDIWKQLAIPGFERYWIDIDGRIVDQNNQRAQCRRQKWHGIRATLTDGKGKRKDFNVARLVLMTFAPTKDPDRDQIIYLDGDYWNPKLSNVAWCTKAEKYQLKIEASNNRKAQIAQMGMGVSSSF